MPAKVDAKMHFGKWHDIEVEDDVTAYVEYENGATGTFITSTGDVPGTNRFEILLEGGKLLAEDGKLTLWKLNMFEKEFSKTTTVAFSAPEMEKIEVETDGKNEQHVGVLNAFAAAVLRNEPLVADGREGINGLTISNALHMSGFLGKEIDIRSFDNELFYEELSKRIATSKRKTNVKDTVASDMGASFR
jgi:predicted dehydrogenase